MSHQLSVREDGFVEFAFTGQREAIWHRLGNVMEPGANIAQWITQSGCDWEAVEAPIQFIGLNESFNNYNGKKVLYRSDTGAQLSIVGDDFKIVQPGEVIEFFRDLTEMHGMNLSSAGVLFGGTRFWALAETGKTVQLHDNDKIDAYLLLVTAIDGTMATTAKFVAERVVCHNTMTIAVNETRGKGFIKQTHKKAWDARQVKIDLGILDAGWENYMDKIKTLSEFPMKETQVLDFYKDMFYVPLLTDDEQSWGATRKVDELMKLYANGDGAELAYGTAWGALNGITNMFTHGSGKRNPSHQFWDSYNGNGEKVKAEAFDFLLEMAED
jgi:phage/plasmid-like protein (TIGR03299 family)